MTDSNDITEDVRQRIEEGGEGDADSSRDSTDDPLLTLDNDEGESE